jgi:hypothetical protein
MSDRRTATACASALIVPVPPQSVTTATDQAPRTISA